MQDLLEKYALQNAVRYDGKAAIGSVIGQVVREHPELKSQVKELQNLAKAIVEKINALSQEKQRESLEKLAPELLEKKEHKEPDRFAFLGVAEGEVLVTGFPPEPSKYPHIGHAKACLLNYEFAKRYNGRFALRFDDTNPTLAQAEFYDIVLDNLRWLGVMPDRIDIGSDRMNELYEFAEQLIADGHCFVCDCDAEITNQLRYAGKPCAHREQAAAETQKRWAALSEGEVLRLRIDANHQNTTMRDPTIFRVITEPHTRTGTKYRIWPTYDFETCLMDSLQGITYRLRSKEFELRTQLHQYIQQLCGFGPTRYYEFARFELVGVETKGRVIREKIQNGEMIGWDDPSLATLVALRRRGFTPQAIKSFILSTGLTKTESTLTWDDLYLHNRRVLNDTAKRLFFVENPTTVRVEGAPQRSVHLSFFPTEKGGERSFQTNEEFLVAADDVALLEEGALYRFMDCINFRKHGSRYVFDSVELEKYKTKGKRIMHFLPANHECVSVTVLMPDKTLRSGVAESRVASLAIGDIIQFERFGFCRLDAVEGATFKFWFTHK